METDDNKSYTEADTLDNDLVHAVDNLFLESISDLLFTGKASDCQSYSGCAGELLSSIAHRDMRSFQQSCQ